MIGALIAFIALFAILFLGLPLAFALGLVGFVAFALESGLHASSAMVAQTTWDAMSNYNLSVVPLFVLMGNLINHSGLSRELYNASNAFVGHRRGGLAIATILASGGFAAVSGSSIATAATISTVALPSMRRYGYSQSLSAGSVAAGGTLGILIPPSVVMVIYGSMTETNIGHLFIAGILPGLLAILLYILAIVVVTTIDPSAGPPSERLPWLARFKALRQVWAVLLLFIVVIGGIYIGAFTPTEAAGIGASGAFAIALLRRTLSVREFSRILFDSARTSALLLAILVGALIFTNFINVSGASSTIVGALTGANLPPLLVISFILLIYLVLGCVFDTISMILLTIPIFFPIVMGLGYDPVWFGVIVVVVVELGLITPPIGANLFVIQTVDRSISISTLYRGVLPFIIVDILRLAILVLIPSIILFLPRQMG